MLVVTVIVTEFVYFIQLFRAMYPVVAKVTVITCITDTQAKLPVIYATLRCYFLRMAQKDYKSQEEKNISM